MIALSENNNATTRCLMFGRTDLEIRTPGLRQAELEDGAG